MVEEGTLPGSTLYAMMTMIPKPGKNTTHKKENHRPVSPTNRHKSPQQNTNKTNPNTLEESYMIFWHDQVGFIPGMQGFFNICKSIILTHIHKLKN